MNKRVWHSVKEQKPQEGQKVYYFSKNIGMFRGEFHIIESSYANPNKFSSNHGVVDSDDVSHWMPYDHGIKDIIPLPPDYGIHHQEISDELELTDKQKHFEFTYEIAGDII